MVPSPSPTKLSLYAATRNVVSRELTRRTFPTQNNMVPKGYFNLTASRHASAVTAQFVGLYHGHHGFGMSIAVILAVISSAVSRRS